LRNGFPCGVLALQGCRVVCSKNFLFLLQQSYLIDYID
jgi:hypothetical protein